MKKEDVQRPNPEETPKYRDHKSEEEVAKEIMEE